MYSNIKQSVIDQIKAMSREFLGMSRYSIAAAILISEYLGYHPSMPGVPNFLNAEPEMDGRLGYRHTTRLTQIAEVLLLLSESPAAFDETIRRMRGRDLESAFLEAQATMIFIRAGFGIEARPEVGKKGLDFDFIAADKDMKVNVEVTHFTNPAYREETVRDALKRKASQLPKDEPNVVVCFYPRAWFDAKFEADYKALNPVITDCLRQTKRVNVVYMMSVATIDDPMMKGAGYLNIVRYKWFNKEPRSPIDNSRLSKAYPPKLLLADGEESTAWKRWNGLAGQVRTEYFEWVDILLSRTAKRRF